MNASSFIPSHRIDVADMPPYSLYVQKRYDGYYLEDGKEYKPEDGDATVDLRDGDTVDILLAKIGSLMVENGRLHYEANENRSTEQSLRKHIQELQRSVSNLKMERDTLETDLCLMKDVIRHMLESR